MHTSTWFAAIRRASLAGIALLTIGSVANAQRAAGRGGGRSGGFSAAPSGSPMQFVREELKLSDYFEFLDDRKKQIGLEKAQQESVKQLKKQMEEEEKPLLKEIEKVLSDAERSAMAGGGASGGRGEGGRGRGGMPAGARDMVQQLITIQEGYATKAQGLLTAPQKQIADSLNTIYVADLRERQQRRARG